MREYGKHWHSYRVWYVRAFLVSMVCTDILMEYGEFEHSYGVWQVGVFLRSMVCTGILISKWLAVQCLRCGWVPPPPPWPPLLSSTETLADISSSLKWFSLMPIEGKGRVALRNQMIF